MKKQRGAGVLGWMYVIAVSTVVFVTLLKIAPAYFEYYTIGRCVDGLKKEEALTNDPQVDAQKILKYLDTRFVINDVRSVNTKNDVHVNRSEGGFLIEMNYEVRKNVFYNIDVVLNFEFKEELRFK